MCLWQQQQQQRLQGADYTVTEAADICLLSGTPGSVDEMSMTEKL